MRITRCILRKYVVVIFLFFISFSSYAIENIAFKAHVFASSEKTPAKNAVDGDKGTRWESHANIDPSWLAIDFGQIYQLTNISIDWEAANPEIYEIQGSNDAQTWTTIIKKTGGVFGDRTDDLVISGQYRYLRIYGIKRSMGNSWGYSIWEVRVFGFIAGETKLVPISTKASSQLQPASSATDDNSTTRWESEHDDDSAWILLDFGKVQQLVNIIIDWEVANAAIYEVQGSNNNTNWITLARVEEGVFGNRQDKINLSGNYRYLRISCIKRSKGNLWGYSIWNIVVNGIENIQYKTLYDENTTLEPATIINTSKALITRFVDRARDRHAREDMFHAYDHYLSFYWESRTAQIEIIDEIAKGGTKITFNVRTEWPLDNTDFRAFFRGVNTVAEYFHNIGMQRDANDPLKYQAILEYNPKESRAIQKNDRIECEISQFLNNPPNGRDNYYGSAFLYIVGRGIVPWQEVGPLKDSYPLPVISYLGGGTTVAQQYSDEPEQLFNQMAGNTAPQNGQIFMLGRRIHHTDFKTGEHSEPGNPPLMEMVGKMGNKFINQSCVSCHNNNGRGIPPSTGKILTNYEVRVGDSNGNPHPELGSVIKTQNSSGAPDTLVKINRWEESNGLRKPIFSFEPIKPKYFSARLTPQLVGMGLLEAIKESDIEALANSSANIKNGVAGRMHIIKDLETGEPRVGRYGWKAGRATLRQMIAGALNAAMSVTTSIMPATDCGNSSCGNGEPLSDDELEELVKYTALLAVRAQRNADDPIVQNGKQIFQNIGCAQCHKPTFTTSEFHPLAELRNQTIHPYTDLLLHDMGEELADSLGEGDAKGSEWRTAPLWNIGLTNGVSGTTAFLHDGRARTINEAILWHGGQGKASKDAYNNLSDVAKSSLLQFIGSL